MTSLPKLRIVSSVEDRVHSARNMRVFLGDQDISGFTSRVTLDLNANSGDPVSVTLTLYPGCLDVETIALINLVNESVDTPKEDQE